MESSTVKTNELKNKTIDLLEKPIINGETIGINFYFSSDKDVFSWNTLSKKDKEEAEKRVSIPEITPEVDLKKQTTINLNTDKKGQNPNSERTKEKEEEKGVIDLFLLSAAITTFLLFFLTSLSFSVAVPIVLTGLFLVVGVLFLGWDYILPKILSEGWLQRLGYETNVRQNNQDKTEEDIPR